MADGILGLSPRNSGKHSLLAELKIAGLIDKTQVSFSNAFYRGTELFKKSKDGNSYIMFGGFNESQIVGGEEGLVTLPMASEKVNPTYYWGVEGWGFAYGETVVMDPKSMNEPINAVIDSGTTLNIIPQDVYETFVDVLAKKFENDTSVSLVCQRTKSKGQVEMCYFNKTKCEDMYKKLDPIKFQFGAYIFEQDPIAYLKEYDYKKSKMCTIHLRGSKESGDSKRKNRFLMGNVFLKNFYSVYDFDQQAVLLGVNVHSKDWARIEKYSHKLWKNFKRHPRLAHQPDVQELMKKYPVPPPEKEDDDSEDSMKDPAGKNHKAVKK